MTFRQTPTLHEMYDGTGYQGGNIYRKRTYTEWEEWFAWRPVKVNGKRVWMKKVFRRCINTYVDHDDWTRYEYGTAFDVIRGDSAPEWNERVDASPLFKGLQDG